jgi:hypothetical protein
MLHERSSYGANLYLSTNLKRIKRALGKKSPLLKGVAKDVFFFSSSFWLLIDSGCVQVSL